MIRGRNVGERARLMEKTGLKVWYVGDRTEGQSFPMPARRVYFTKRENCVQIDTVYDKIGKE